MIEVNKQLELSALKTPCYVYNLDFLNQTLLQCKKAFEPFNFKVHYALKANANQTILNVINKQGFGADCVSGNEIIRALETGFTPNKIAFAGVGKTDWEMELGLAHNIFSFNVESVEEIEILNQIAQKLNKTANVALRLNPNVDAKTHAYITTGLEENKFGINPWDYARIFEGLPHWKNINIEGLHFHVGSQITNLDVFKNLCLKANEIQSYFEQNRLYFKHINVGGGLGINYTNPTEEPFANFESYFKIFHSFFNLRPNQELHFELGRALVANCGQLISKVLFVKKGIKTNFVILDAGMTELLRPALYQAYHKIENVSNNNKPEFKYDVVGPICESSDSFGKQILLPETKRNHFLAIKSAGAYGEVMASGYNLRHLPHVYFGTFS